MKLVNKLALLGCASIGLVGMAQAQVTVKQLGNVQDMACVLPSLAQETNAIPASTRLAHYKIHNSGPTEVALDFELYNNDSFPDSVITFNKVSCGTVDSGDFATGVLASHADCQIDLLISPPTCPVINGYPVGDIDAEYGPGSGVINRAIEIDINTRQVDLTIPLTGNTKSAHLPRVTTLGAAAEFGLLAGKLSNDDNEGPSQVNFGNVGAGVGITGQIQMIDGIKYPNNALPTQIALLDVQSAFDMFDQIEGCDYPTSPVNMDNLDLSGETLVPGYYCLDGQYVAEEQTLTLNGDGVYVFYVYPDRTKNALDGFELQSFASVVLENGAKADNVYWVVYENSLYIDYENTIVGNIISALNFDNPDANLSPFDGDISQVNGRILTTQSISLYGNSIIVP